MISNSSSKCFDKNSKKSTEDYYNLGLAYYHNGDIDLAIENFKKILDINPHSAKAHYTLAWAYYEKNEETLAVQHINKANDINNYMPENN